MINGTDGQCRRMILVAVAEYFTNVDFSDEKTERGDLFHFQYVLGYKVSDGVTSLTANRK